MKLLEEGKRWILPWSLRYLTCFPCPTARLEGGKLIQHGIDDFFFLLTPNSLEQKQQRTFPVASWRSCWIKLFLKTKHRSI